MTSEGASVLATAKSPREVFGQRAAFYTDSPAHADQGVLSRLVALVKPQPSWRALDVGSGSGHTAFAFAPSVRAVIGADITPEMLAEAAALGRRRGISNVWSCLADAAALPFTTSCFDLVTCRRAAHHFAHLGEALAEIARVLVPGGVFVLDDRSVPEDEFVDRFMNSVDRYHDASHVREYRASEWLALLAGAGLRAEVVEPYVQLRPLKSLTEGADSGAAARIRGLVGGLTAEQRDALGVAEIDGDTHTNHWYLILVARKH